MGSCSHVRSAMRTASAGQGLLADLPLQLNRSYASNGFQHLPVLTQRTTVASSGCLPQPCFTSHSCAVSGLIAVNCTKLLHIQSRLMDGHRAVLSASVQGHMSRWHGTANTSQRASANRALLPPTRRAFSSDSQRATDRCRQQMHRNQQKITEQGLYMVALVVGMVGVTYASVPLYR
jgi:hypothetical protein